MLCVLLLYNNTLLLLAHEQICELKRDKAGLAAALQDSEAYAARHVTDTRAVVQHLGIIHCSRISVPYPDRLQLMKHMKKH